MCTFSVSTNLDHLVAVWRGKVSPVLFVIPVLGENVTTVELLGLVLGLSMTVAYISTKNWIVNNILGISFCLCGIKMIGLSSYKTGAIMLIGLFFYDVFWVFGSKSVFGSNVMVTVATGVEAPIKLMFPRSLGGCGDLKFGMLGLGDIAVPGIFVAFLAKWDAMLIGCGKAASFVYLNVTMVAYVFSLITTVAVMLVFNAAQPALLYIVPYVVITSLALALFRREAKELFSVDIPDDEAQTKDLKPEDKKDQ
jgi:minor histocompatibility antigen H13